MIRQMTSFGLSALALVALAGCGQGADNSSTAELTPVPPKPLAAASEPAPAVTPAPAPAAQTAAPAPTQVAAAAQQYAAPAPAPKKYTLASDNYLKNGGFEEVAESGLPSFWSGVSKGAEFKVDGGDAYAGGQALQADLTADMDFGMWQTLPVTAGATYRLSGYVKTDDITDGVWLEVQDAEKGFANFASRTSVKGAVAEDWTLQSVDFTVPGGVKAINVLVRRPVIEGQDGSAGTAWFDNIAVHAIKEVTTPSLLATGNFENADTLLEGWTEPVKGADVSFSKDAAVGEGALEVALAKDTDLGMRSVVAVEAGKKYVLTGWIKTDELSATARLEVSDAIKGHEQFLAFNEGITGTNGWTEQALVFEVPEGTTGINVVLRVVDQEKGGDAGTVWFDGYRLFPIE